MLPEFEYVHGMAHFVVHRIAEHIAAIVQPDLVAVFPNVLPAPQVSSPSPPSYEIRPSSHGGLGLFATRALPAGTPMLTEHPALILPNDPLPPHLTHLYDDAPHVLNPETRNGLLSLTSCRPPEECSSLIEGIARTNAISLPLPHLVPGITRNPSICDHEHDYGGIFPLINRCNHSCGPNAAHTWHRASLSATLHAVRDIALGEEITITYTDPLQPCATRRARLQRDYRFKCMCLHCEPPPCSTSSHVDQIAKSDHARFLLNTHPQTQPRLSSFLRDPCLPAQPLLSAHSHALELMEQEGLQSLRAAWAGEAALCCAVMADEDGWAVWIRAVASSVWVGEETGNGPELGKETGYDTNEYVGKKGKGNNTSVQLSVKQSVEAVKKWIDDGRIDECPIWGSRKRVVEEMDMRQQKSRNATGDEDEGLTALGTLFAP